MSDELNKKVIDLFSKHKTSDKVKFYAGFNYVRIDKDHYGNKFNPEHLLEYAKNCHYIVRVMRENKGETVLYNYDVPNSELFKFIKSFEENTLDGTIIEIDKYFPDNPA